MIRPEAGRQLCLDTILEYLPEIAPDDYEVALNVEREKVRVAIAEACGWE